MGHREQCSLLFSKKRPKTGVLFKSARSSTLRLQKPAVEGNQSQRPHFIFPRSAFASRGNERGFPRAPEGASAGNETGGLRKWKKAACH
jgi:hypothetical protein